MTDIGGYVEAGFEGVREAFERNFAEHGEVGAAVAAYVGGRKVVDLWGGDADHDGTPYGEDTLQLVFSTTKGVTAICANLLAQRGELDVEAPVSQYWPEFAAAGKADVPVRWLLGHKVGLPYVDRDLSLDEVLAWDPVVKALAEQTPLWEPGTEHGYHAVTYGWLVGEVIRRVTGRSLGAFVADELSGPLGLELWVGLPDEQQARVAPLTNYGPGGGRAGAGAGGAGAAAAGELPADLGSMIEQFLGPDSLLLKALGGVPGLFTQEGMFNRPEVRAAELPAANGVSNARSLAKLYAATVGTVDELPGVGPLLTEEQIAAATTVQTSGPDKVLFFETLFGLGFMRSSPFSPYGAPESFGHSGAGGSLAFADPVNGIGFAYVMNRMLQNLAGDPRTTGLVKAVYDAIGVEPTYV
ncbi:MAG TPA: serine hydrolase domain-containing protein [Acidimicrobiales bacterium]|nr:serine hydrolase domain-containing protein [Acidimicrobiales bacterium]